MARQWISLGTGVRYYETSDVITDPKDNRKKRPARVYALTYKYEGKAKSEGIGPEPEISEEYAMKIASLLAENRKKGIRPATYAEMKEARNQEYLETKAEEDKARKNTFGAFFEEVYLQYKKGEVASGSIKEGTLQDVISRYEFWLKPDLDSMVFDDEDPEKSPEKTPEPSGPSIASLTFDEIQDSHFQALAAKMRRRVRKVKRVRDFAAEDERAVNGKRFERQYRYERVIEERRTLRLLQSVRATAHEIWNYAQDKGYTSKPFPGKKIARGTPQNERTKFYTEEEVGIILSALKKRSLDVYHLAMISLYTGLRAGACLRLTWQDLDQGVSRDTKNKTSVPIPFLHQVHDLDTVVAERKSLFPGCKKSDWIFPKKNDPSQHQEQVSATFKRTVEDLRINEDVKDRRGRGVFHTLRHTFASWLVQDGESLAKVGAYMGQKTPRMTQRYSHLAPEHYQSAADKLNKRRIKISEYPNSQIA